MVLGLVVGAVGLEGLYVVGANAFFASKKLEGYISSDDGNFALRYDHLRTWLPGRYHVENLTIQSRGLGVQWVLGIDQADFTTNPLTLVKHRFDVSKVTASGVSFRLRTTEPGDKAKREEIQGFPPIPGYDDLDPVAPAPATPVDELWEVSIRDIDAHAKEIWTEQFRHAGDIRAQGKFTLVPGLYFEVGPASLDLQGVVVTVGKSTMASTLDGHVDALMAPNSIIDPGRSSVLAQTDMQVSLDAQLASVIGWQTFWPAGVMASDGSGQLKVRARVTRGLLDGGSRVTYDARRLVVHDDTVTAVLPVSLEWVVADDADSSQCHVDIPSVEVSREGYRGEGARLSAVQATLSTGPFDAAGLWELRHVKAAVGAFEAPDVRFFNVEALTSRGFVFEHGVARAHGDIDIEMPDTASGDLRLTVEGLTARYHGDQAHAEVAFFAHAPASSLAKGLALSSARLDLRDVFAHAQGKEIKQWWARLDVGSAKLAVTPEVAFKGPVSFHAKDASPFLAFALDAGGIEGVLRDHLDSDPLEARATVEADPEQIDLRVPVVKGGPYQLSGRVLLRDEDRCGALLVERDPLSLGIRLHGKSTDLRPMVGSSWLAEHAGGPGDGQVPGCSRKPAPKHEAAGKGEATHAKGEHPQAPVKGGHAGQPSVRAP